MSPEPPLPTATAAADAVARLEVGEVLDAASLFLPHAAVAPEQDRTGGTTTATVPFDGVDGLDAGVWEMSAGTMTDVEADELFVVLAGRATVEILPAHGFAAAVAELRPGSVMRLAAGMHTVWTVTEPLRKVYVSL